MKLLFLLGLLVVIFACYKAQETEKYYLAKIEGNCDESEFSESDLETCGLFECNKYENGTKSMKGTLCGLAACPDGRPPIPGDLTKKYPDCCPVYDCSAPSVQLGD